MGVLRVLLLLLLLLREAWQHLVLVVKSGEMAGLVGWRRVVHHLRRQKRADLRAKAHKKRREEEG